MYKRLDERRLDCARLAPGRVPVRRLPRPSLSIHVKNLRSGGGKCRRGRDRGDHFKVVGLKNLANTKKH